MISLERLAKENGLTLRWAGPEYRDGVRALVDRVFEEYGLSNLLTWYDTHPDAWDKEFFGTDPKRRAGWVLTRRGEVRGAGILIPQHDCRDGTWGEISKLYLDADLRGKGLGKALLIELLAQAPHSFFRRIYLTTRREFEDAIGLYRHTGFVESATPKYGSKNLVSMEREL